MTIRYVSGDYHLCHNNILYFEEPRKRFKDITMMNDYIIRQHNEQVKPEDIVYHVGDFFLKDKLCVDPDGNKLKYRHFYNQLNGTIILLKGNHDHPNGVKTHCDSLQIEFMNTKINMCHKPGDARSDVDLNLSGHIHSKAKFICYDDKKIINVGLDAWNFKLNTLNFFVELYRKTDWEKVKGYTFK